jgi:outer membrane protein W
MPGIAAGQATKGQYVADFGAAYAKALDSDAKSGFVGLDMFAGKMITSNICLGLGVGADIISYEKVGDMHSRLAVIPLLVKAKYYLNLGPMLQAYVSAGAGAYAVSTHLHEPIGDIRYSMNQPGGAVGVGIDYWFLLLQGIGFSVEYHMFKTDIDPFSYFVARVEYCLIKL